MRKFLFVLLLLSIPVIANAQDDDKYPPVKMQIVVQEVLNAFKSSSISTSILGKYISHEWLDDKGLQIKNFNINSYSPTYYEIQLIFDRYVVAEVGGDGWAHLLVFKFIDEDGVYRLIPKGISDVSKDYIDPWYDVKSYINEER